MAGVGLFFREFIRNFHTTGAILPSGRALAKALTRFVAAPSDRPRRILEIGPGTGAVTAPLVAALRPDDRLELVELNDSFVGILKERFQNDPAFQPAASRTTIHHCALENLPESEPFDILVSGLPLNNFSAELVESLLTGMMGRLRAGGTLSFFEYIAVRRVRAVISIGKEKQRLRGIGRAMHGVLDRGEFRRDMILTNVPPAWVHHVRRD